MLWSHRDHSKAQGVNQGGHQCPQGAHKSWVVSPWNYAREKQELVIAVVCIYIYIE